MSDHPELVHESLIDALREVVQAAGGMKTVGGKLRPEMAPDVAARWVSDCLNPDRREKFDPDQVLWLLREGRRVGDHSAMHFLAREAGYSTPHPVEPKEAMAELQREFVKAQEKAADMLQRMEQLAAQLAGQGIKPKLVSGGER